MVAATFALASAGSAPLGAQADGASEKSWGLEVGVDYASLYVFRGVNALGEDQEALSPFATFTVGGLSIGYFGYIADFDGEEGEGSYGETNLSIDYTFEVGKLALTLGGIAYLYTGEVEEAGVLDTWELYGVAAWDVLLQPTISYYQDIDAIEGGYLTFGVGHSFPVVEDKVSIDLSGALSLDFGYNQVDEEAGIEESSGDLNDILLGVDVPWQITERFGVHALLQRSIALDVLDELGQPDETILTVGAVVSF